MAFSFFKMAIYVKFVVKIQKPILTLELAILCFFIKVAALFLQLKTCFNVKIRLISFFPYQKQHSLRNES